MKRVLIVDDDAAVLSSLQRALRRHFGPSVDVRTCDDALDALALVRDEHFDVVLTDLHMPELDGTSLLTLLSVVRPQAVRMLITGAADFESERRAIHDADVFRCLGKPWNDDELAVHVGAALAYGAAQGPGLRSAPRWS